MDKLLFFLSYLITHSTLHINTNLSLYIVTYTTYRKSHMKTVELSIIYMHDMYKLFFYDEHLLRKKEIFFLRQI